MNSLWAKKEVYSNHNLKSNLLQLEKEKEEGSQNKWMIMNNILLIQRIIKKKYVSFYILFSFHYRVMIYK